MTQAQKKTLNLNSNLSEKKQLLLASYSKSGKVKAASRLPKYRQELIEAAHALCNASHQAKITNQTRLEAGEEVLFIKNNKLIRQAKFGKAKKVATLHPLRKVSSLKKLLNNSLKVNIEIHSADVEPLRKTSDKKHTVE